MLTRRWPLARGLRRPDGRPVPLQARRLSGRPEGGPATRQTAPRLVGRVGGLQSGFAHASGQTLPGETPLPTWASSPGPTE